MGSFVSERMI